ncbi:MAG TPA: HlyC/CorC family transporter [Chloroflexi bacterium]|nr:HlyC/CorC family transporter [Chloroflexota bacterium]HPO57907.1 hemolysin family protein [Anaerolineaceae bacterium]
MDNQILLLFVVLLVVDLLVVFLRSAVINARVPQLMSLRGQTTKNLDRTLDLVDRLSLRVALRFITSLAHFMLGVTTWLLLWSLFPQPEMGWALLALAGAVLVILLIEYGIEGLILKDPEAWTLRLTGAAGLLDLLLRPFSALFIALLGSSATLDRRALAVTEDELKNWVEVGQEEGSLEKDERQMIYSIFHFGDTLVREIMIPRIDILALEVNTSLEEAIQALTLSGHSRVPVYEETIDNIIGMLYAKDLLRVHIENGIEDPIRQFLRPAFFVPEAKKVDELLREMQKNSYHIAVVVDEYGGMAGLVTMEDIVEEIVGEIRDEYDQGEEQLYQRLENGSYLLSGRLDLDDVNDMLGTHLTKDMADTLGGFLYGTIGRVPIGGEQVHVEDWTLTIELVTGRRIRKVRAEQRQYESLEVPQEKNDDKR